MLPQWTYWPVNWADGMKITRAHLLANDNAFREQGRDATGLLLNGLNYGLLPPAPGKDTSLSISCDGQEIVLSICRAITVGGARVEYDSSLTGDVLRLPLSKVREDWARAGQTTGYVLIEVNPFEPQPWGQPDPYEIPLRYPFIMPSYRLSVSTLLSLDTTLSAAYHIPIGKVTLTNGQFSLSPDYYPPCRVTGAYPALLQQYQVIGSQMGEIAGYATAIIVRVKTNARSGQPNLLATTIGNLADASVRSIADGLDAYQLRGLHESPAFIAEFGMRLARTMTLAIRSTPDREKESMYNYFKNWCGVNPVDLEAALQQVLDVEYVHADCQPVIRAINKLTDVTIALYSKLSQLNYMEKDKDEFFVDRQDTSQKAQPKRSFWGN